MVNDMVYQNVLLRWRDPARPWSSLTSEVWSENVGCFCSMEHMLVMSITLELYRYTYTYCGIIFHFTCYHWNCCFVTDFQTCLRLVHPASEEGLKEENSLRGGTRQGDLILQNIFIFESFRHVVQSVRKGCRQSTPRSSTDMRCCDSYWTGFCEAVMRFDMFEAFSSCTRTRQLGKPCWNL